MIASDPAYFPTDPHPVRPGTSAALTARTIDATKPPPLKQAQETVAAAIPQITATVTSPLFVTAVGLTLVMVWMAFCMRSRLIGLALSAMLVMALTSFHPMRIPQESQNVGQQPVDQQQVDEQRDYDVPRPANETPDWYERRRFDPQDNEHAPYTVRLPRRPDVVRPDFDRIMDDEEAFREAVEELRGRIEAELRRRAREQRSYHDQNRIHYEYRSTRWLRKLPKPVREWAYDRQATIVAWARDP